MIDYSWISDDKTWCSSDCNNIDCHRHPANMLNKQGLHSYADFKGTGECPLEASKDESGRDKSDD